jgi:ABC-type transporter Mla subunit MlaD
VRSRVNAFVATGAEAAYGNVRKNLDRLLPAFLRRPTPLTHADIMEAVESLRPSRQAGALDRLIDDFVRRLEPLAATIEASANELFASFREVVQLVNPLSIRDSVAAIYDTLRRKVRILDPVVLAERIRQTFFDPIRNALTALDPAQLKARLDAAFRRVLDALTNNVRGILDDIVAAIDEQLRTIREALGRLVTRITEVVRTAVEAVQNVLNQLENLVFVELLERIRRMIDNLETSFGRELDRVRAAFDEMLNAIPLGGGASASASAG